MHICLPADESNQEVTYENQDDAYGLVIAAVCNHWVWRRAFPGGQRDPVAGGLLSPVQRVQPQPPAGKPPLVCDPNPRDPVRDREWAEEHKKPLSVSHAKDDHREAGANADRGDQDSDDAVGKG